jgi:bla regulator protein BlaR1
MRLCALSIAAMPALNASAQASATAEASAHPAVSFDVASVRPNKAEGSNNTTWHHDKDTIRLTYVDTPLIYCLQKAYDLKEYQISGPDWLKSVRYDIAASGPYAGDDQAWRIMLQQLLAERFNLKVHLKSRKLPVYTLAIGKIGPRLQKTEAAAAGSNLTVRNGQLTAQRISMASFADFLSRVVDRPVLDKTGLAGRFNFTLHYSELAQSTNPQQANAAIDTSDPIIFTALQEQLGLKLESTKGPVETLVIDHVEQPSEN